MNVIGEMLVWFAESSISNNFNLKFVVILFHKAIIFLFQLIYLLFIFFNIFVINFLNDV